MRKWLPLLAICLGTFMLLIDVTIVTVALPDIGGDLGASASGLQWVMDAYALVLAALLLGAGSLADLIGRRLVYLAGLVVFAGASLACALANGPAMLIAARAVQGVGGAAMLATTVALINVCYQGRDRGTAFGVWGAVNGGAAAAGPILGGLLTQHAGWHWIFLVNLPVSVLTVVLAWLFLPRQEARRTRGGGVGRVDLPGMATFTLGAGALTYGLTLSGTDGWSSARTLGALGLGVVALAAFVLLERGRSMPMLDLGLFRRRAFTGVMLSALLSQAAAFAYLPYTSLWLQSVLGKGPVDAGLALLPLSLVAFVAAAIAGRLTHGRSPRAALGGGSLLIGAGALLETLVGAHSSAGALLPGLVVAGIGAGCVVPTLAAAALGSVPHERSGMASGAVNTFRQLGYAFGVAIFGTVFTMRAAGALRALHTPLPAGTARAVAAGRSPVLVAHHALTSAATHAVAASALSRVCLIAGLVGVAGGLLALVLLRPGRPVADVPAAAAREPVAAAD